MIKELTKKNIKELHKSIKKYKVDEVDVLEIIESHLIKSMNEAYKQGKEEVKNKLITDLQTMKFQIWKMPKNEMLNLNEETGKATTLAHKVVDYIIKLIKNPK